MSRLNLPEGADTGFRLELWDAFHNRFTANIYGAGRRGWFIANHKGREPTRSIGPQPLVRGQWREFLGLIKQAGFWELPATIPDDPNVFTDDGAWLSLAGRSGERYHHVHRKAHRCGHGLFRVQRFLTRLSGFFPEPRPSRPAETSSIVDNDVSQADAAEDSVE